MAAITSAAPSSCSCGAQTFTTYIHTRAGFIYAAFIMGAFSRRFIGWILSDSMQTETLPLQAFSQAIPGAKENDRGG